jgi:hypothetical protein
MFAVGIIMYTASQVGLRRKLAPELASCELEDIQLQE